MADLILTGGLGELTWEISGLGDTFNTGNGYVRAGITRNQFTVGGVSSITGIISYKNATASGSSTTVWRTIPYKPGTYKFWGFVETKLGGYWPAGYGMVTVDEEAEPEPVRPPNWSWGYTIKPGARLPTAREWDNFCDRINEFRAYRGLSVYSFTRAYPGPTTMTADMVNQTIKAIQVMSPLISLPSNAVKNVTKLSADLLDGLTASLNSIR